MFVTSVETIKNKSSMHKAVVRYTWYLPSCTMYNYVEYKKKIVLRNVISRNIRNYCISNEYNILFKYGTISTR